MWKSCVTTMNTVAEHEVQFCVRSAAQYSIWTVCVLYCALLLLTPNSTGVCFYILPAGLLQVLAVLPAVFHLWVTSVHSECSVVTCSQLLNLSTSNHPMMALLWLQWLCWLTIKSRINRKLCLIMCVYVSTSHHSISPAAFRLLQSLAVSLEWDLPSADMAAFTKLSTELSLHNAVLLHWTCWSNTFPDYLHYFDSFWHQMFPQIWTNSKIILSLF